MSRFILKQFADEAVVYDADSGDTHYLQPLTFALYQVCREHPGYTAEQLATTLARRLDVTDLSKFDMAVEDALAGLYHIGLLQSP